MCGVHLDKGTKIKNIKNSKIFWTLNAKLFPVGVSSHSQRRKKKGFLAECSGSRVEVGVDGSPVGGQSSYW